MTETRASIRRRAVSLAIVNGRSLGISSRDGVNALTATGGTVTTLIDTAGLPSGADSTMAKGWWLYRPTAAAADQRRLIASYDGSTRAFTIEGANYAVAPVNTDPYLVLREDPDDWNRAVAEAMQQLISRIEYDTITIASQLPRYDLSAAPFSLSAIVRDSQVMELEYAGADETAGQETWKPWADGVQTWRAYIDGGDGKIWLDFGDKDRAPDTSVKLRIKWSRQYAALTDETTAAAVDQYWAALTTLAVMCDWYADPDNPGSDWNVLQRRVKPQAMAQRRLILGEDAFRSVNRTAQVAARVSVRGRGGRGRGR